ncbi:NAD(P)-dependent oxidoreductase [Cellulomonas sp. KRMCY2]|uniref:NAD(P)-dependent oxidoreductase n=1 Tax=Cellulomonas sp. KRMCY2 TaxID=1304865 RepID=UPI00045E8B51|nr:NAD(P)-dependent oxidoreductase [Cellulomonas sp. KRMCY2]
MTVTISRDDAVLGFVGLGNLGAAMALRLVERGWSVRVLDRDDARVAELVEAGALRVDPAGLAECDVIIFATPDERAIRQVLALDEPEPHVRAGQRLVVHSTIRPSAARDLADAAERHGAHVVDAPVSGGADRARRGALALMLGGDAEGLDALAPVLDDLADSQSRLGPVGAGSAVKLAHQLVMFATLAAVHEAISLVESAGVAPSAMLAAVNHGLADSWVGRNVGFFDELARTYDEAGTPVEERPWSKDLAAAAAAGHDAGLDLPLATLLAARLASLVEDHARTTREEATA